MFLLSTCSIRSEKKVLMYGMLKRRIRIRYPHAVLSAAKEKQDNDVGGFCPKSCPKLWLWKSWNAEEANSHRLSPRWTKRSQGQARQRRRRFLSEILSTALAPEVKLPCIKTREINTDRLGLLFLRRNTASRNTLYQWYGRTCAGCMISIPVRTIYCSAQWQPYM